MHTKMKQYASLYVRHPMKPHLILLFSLALAAFGCSTSDGWYESCESSDECVGGTECVTVAFAAGRDGAMCTADCERHSECPFGGACYELVGDPLAEQRVCYNRCQFDEECGPGLLCADAEMDGGIIDRICLPE